MSKSDYISNKTNYVWWRWFWIFGNYGFWLIILSGNYYANLSATLYSLAQSCHFKKWGRDISFTSRAAASEGNKNSLWVMKGTIIFTHERLSRNTEEKFPHERRSREWGNLFSVWLLSLEWVNIIVPWMTNREFFPSPFFKMTGLTFLFTYWKLFRSATNH